MAKLEQIEPASVVQRQPQAQTPRDTDAQMKASPCQEGDDSRGVKRTESQVQLSEDIFHRIHAVLPMRDAAQAACVSRDFLRSWRCYPNLFFSVNSLGIKGDLSEVDKITKDFIRRVDHIMRSHSGMGVKEFRVHSYPCVLDPSFVDRWLQVAITPGIKEVELSFFDFGQTKYNFPCSLLSSERGSSIRSILLSTCSVHSAAQVGCLSSLTKLDLQSVDITGERLYCFLTKSCALEKLFLTNCNNIICLRIPYQLQQLNILRVLDCGKLEMIESSAPSLSAFLYRGWKKIHISLGDASQVRKINFHLDYSPDTLYYACTKLPFIAPNLQTLVLATSNETVNTAMALGRFLQLKYLEIVVTGTNFSPEYDFYSLVSFLDASPSLETFIFRIHSLTIRHDSIVENPGGDFSQPRCLSENCHENLKNMMITGFCSAKSMIEFTIHIIEKAKSLECLTLDTTRGHDRRFAKIDRCWPLSEEAPVEARKARVAIREHIEGRVPPAVNLKIIKPCSKCMKR